MLRRMWAEIVRGHDVAVRIELHLQPRRADLDTLTSFEGGKTSFRDEKPPYLRGVRDLDDADVLEAMRANGGQCRRDRVAAPWAA